MKSQERVLHGDETVSINDLRQKELVRFDNWILPVLSLRDSYITAWSIGINLLAFPMRDQ